MAQPGEFFPDPNAAEADALSQQHNQTGVNNFQPADAPDAPKLDQIAITPNGIKTDDGRVLVNGMWVDPSLTEIAYGEY